MAKPLSGGRVTFIVLRTMRTPIMIVVGIYAASMVGWVMIPAVDVEGQPHFGLVISRFAAAFPGVQEHAHDGAAVADIHAHCADRLRKLFDLGQSGFGQDGLAGLGADAGALAN